jgi:hypothetical protein
MLTPIPFAKRYQIDEQGRDGDPTLGIIGADAAHPPMDARGGE